MNPNDPYFHQVQPDYKQHQPAAVTPTYGGSPQHPIIPGPPAATIQPPQQFTSNWPPQMTPHYGQPLPRPPTQQHGLLEQIRQNQLTQQMRSMNLMNPGIYSSLSSDGSNSLINVNISPAPPPVMVQRPDFNMKESSPMQPWQQHMIHGIGALPQGALLPLTIQQQQQMGMSSQKYQKRSGLLIHFNFLSITNSTSQMLIGTFPGLGGQQP